MPEHAQASLAFFDKVQGALGLIVRIIVFSSANYWQQIQHIVWVCF